MKQLLITFLIVSSIQFANAQLAGTKYQTIMNAPSPVSIILKFEKDTLFFLLAEDTPDQLKNSIVETATYTFNNNLLTMYKVSGGSPCANTAKGIYKIDLKEDKLFITLVDDECSERSYAFNKDPMVRIH